MISLGGLLFRSKVDSDRSQFVMIPKMLKDLVPADQIKIMSPEDWKKVKGEMYTVIFKKNIGMEKDWERARFYTTVFTVRLRSLTVVLLRSLLRLQHIISSYNRQSGITVQEARIAFLTAISSWPTFGCSFFDVKVSDGGEVRAKFA